MINAVARVCSSAILQAKSQLRINSPSKVFEEIGGYTAEGFGIGYQDKMADVNRMVRESVDFEGIESSIGFAKPVYGASGGANDVLRVLEEYLPYLVDISRKEMSLYPSKRKFELETAQAANRGLGVIKRRAERR